MAEQVAGVLREGMLSGRGRETLLGSTRLPGSFKRVERKILRRFKREF